VGPKANHDPPAFDSYSNKIESHLHFATLNGVFPSEEERFAKSTSFILLMTRTPCELCQSDRFFFLRETRNEELTMLYRSKSFSFFPSKDSNGASQNCTFGTRLSTGVHRRITRGNFVSTN
jgi:hypothetical protein